MTALIDLVVQHTLRGECRCGRCIDVIGRPDPDGHTTDLVFFKVARKGDLSIAEFREASAAHQGEFNEVDVFDGAEHGYMELGGWIGDQGLALQYMGLGVLLGVFKLFTPKMLMPWLDDETEMQIAGRGFVTVQARSPESVPA